MTLPATANANALLHAHATPARTHIPPAKLAREQLAANPDLVDSPFGELVSKLAAEQEKPDRGGTALPSRE